MRLYVMSLCMPSVIPPGVRPAVHNVSPGMPVWMDAGQNVYLATTPMVTQVWKILLKN